MIFDVDVRGRRHHVEVVRTVDGDHVSIDGRMFSGQMAGASPFWSLLIDESTAVPANTAFRSAEVSFSFDATTGTVDVDVNGTTVPVRLVDRRRSRPRGPMADERAGVRPVIAPMPGRIVRVCVGRGQRVSAQQPLVVMEAMKMENELHAPIAGTVSEIHVEAGSAVDAGTLLAVVTPFADTHA